METRFFLAILDISPCDGPRQMDNGPHSWVSSDRGQSHLWVPTTVHLSAWFFINRAPVGSLNLCNKVHCHRDSVTEIPLSPRFPARHAACHGRIINPAQAEDRR